MRLVLSVAKAPFLVDTQFFSQCGEVAGQRLFESPSAAAVRLMRAAVREVPVAQSLHLRESVKMVARPTLFVFWFPPPSWSLEQVPHLAGHLVDVREHRQHEERERRHSKMAYLDTLFTKVLAERAQAA